jgi:hypothetical protein
MFIDGFLSLCSAAGSGAVTEMSTQPRQPISFSLPEFRHPLSGAYGVSRNVKRVSFSYLVTGPVAGFGLFDAPTGGNLLLALPLFSARPIIGGGRAYAADEGDLYISIAALAANPHGASYSGSVAASAQIGSFWDTAQIIGPGSTTPAPGAYMPAGGHVPQAVNSMPATAGVALAIFRGTLAAASATA